jgi:hypothetical protein
MATITLSAVKSSSEGLHTLKSNSHTSTTAARLSQGPSVEDWERLRLVITRLYIDEDRTLANVMNTMALNYGHKGTYVVFNLTRLDLASLTSVQRQDVQKPPCAVAVSQA